MASEKEEIWYETADNRGCVIVAGKRLENMAG